jgi:D-alanyl-D-alanine carboxypeptidase/D-alanyl-D-alanine-endopeptidase (penicillin-binding protein 4)
MNTDSHKFFRNNSRSLVLICLLFSLSIFLNCSSKNQAAEDDSQTSEETAFEVQPPVIDLSKPLEISNKPEDVALAKRIDEIIENSELSNSRWGVFVVSLKDGRVLVAKDAQKLFNPASIQKTLTSIVALDKLGAEFRWKTHVYAKNKIESDGSLNGDLVLYGEGAPDFDTENLNNLVAQLRAKGLKKVKGNIVGDESFFKGDELGDGWVWGDLQWYYGAESSALTFNKNLVKLEIDGTGKLKDSSNNLQIKSDLKPKSPGERDSWGIKRGLSNNEVYVWGNSGATTAQLAVHNPAMWAAKSLKETLEQKGIVVEGSAKSSDWKSEDTFDPVISVELASVQSKTLGEIVRYMNKNSVNIYAELLLRTIGKKFGDTAPDENKSVQKVRGDDLAGTAVIEKFLTENNVATTEIEIHDGSGLSRLDFVTPESFGRALLYAAQSKYANVFENSLPVAGTDGTLAGRLGNVRGNIMAKTGSISYVNSLAGYAKRKDEILAFAIICNNATRKTDSAKIIDQIAANLVKKSDQTPADKTNLNQNSANKEN